jgi:hypothetical protein
MVNIWFPLITLVLLTTTFVGSLIWSSHWFTYVPKPRRASQDSRQFREGGGLLNIMRGYDAHDTDGNALGRVVPLSGCLGATKWAVILLLIAYGCGLAICSIAPSASVLVAAAYWVVVFVVMTIVFPSLLVHIGNVPGQFSFSDMPETPAAWGALLSVYGGAVVARHVFGFNAVEALLSMPVAKPWAALGTAGIPVAFFALFWALLGQMLPGSVPWPTRIVFFIAFTVYFSIAELLVVLLLA